MNHLNKLYLIILLGVFYSGHGLAKTLKIATLAPAGTTWMKEMKRVQGTLMKRQKAESN